MASVQRIVRCGLAVALAKGTANEQDFIDALSYRIMTWGAEDETSCEERHAYRWDKKGLHSEPQREVFFAAC